MTKDDFCLLKFQGDCIWRFLQVPALKTEGVGETQAYAIALAEILPSSSDQFVSDAMKLWLP